MSIVSLAYPAQAAISIAETLSGSAALIVRSALGLGILATLAFLFKPLSAWLLSVVRLVLQPRVSIQRQLLRRIDGVRQLCRLARDIEATQPNLAAELRNLASRG